MTGAGAPGAHPSGRRESPSHPLLVVLSGPSGVGKDSILDELARRGERFHRVTTCTTRSPRRGETDGVDYFFVTDAQFDELIASGGLLEHAEVYGHRSGVPRQQVQEKLEAGDDVFVRADVQGAASIRRLMPDAVLVFVAPSSVEELESRIRARASDGAAALKQRVDAALGEMARRDEFEHVIVNEPGHLARTVDQLQGIIERERAERARTRG